MHEETQTNLSKYTASGIKGLSTKESLVRHIEVFIDRQVAG
jgi:hypothetical protein